MKPDVNLRCDSKYSSLMPSLGKVSKHLKGSLTPPGPTGNTAYPTPLPGGKIQIPHNNETKDLLLPV